MGQGLYPATTSHSTPTVLGVLETLFQRRHIHRHFSSCLAPHEEGHEQPPDAVTLEVDRNRHMRVGIRLTFDRNVDRGSDRPIKTSNAPLMRRIETNDLGSVLSVREPNVACRLTTFSDSRRAGALHPTAHDPLLPFRKAAWVGHIRENDIGRTVDVNARNDRRHVTDPGR
jgi:hypothetical protein